MEVLKEKVQFQKYPAYKDSGVEWLGKIPEHWKVTPGFSFLYEAKEKNTGFKRKQVLSLSYGKIREKGEDELTGLVPESFETYQLVDAGDIIFRPTDLQNDKVSLRSAMSDFDGIITSAYLNLRLKKIADARFYHYFFRSIDDNKVIYGLGSGLRQNIDYRDFRRFRFPFPPKQEQIAIAGFLDEKCGKINAAIAQKEKLIELLKERKQILIQNVVTKGLDPNAKMKDSGVDWIGEIPEHWEVKRLKNVCRINLNALPETTSKNYEFQYVDIGSVTFEKGITITETYKFKSAPSRARRTVKSGDTVISTVRTYLKAIDFVDEVKSAYIYSTGFAVLQPESFVYPEYLAFLVKSNSFTDQVAINSKGMSYPAINSTDLSNLFIVHSDYDTQKMIVRYIKEESAKLEKSINLNLKQIEKLKEYKSSLIDAAVTGKIKIN